MATSISLRSRREIVAAAPRSAHWAGDNANIWKRNSLLNYHKDTGQVKTACALALALLVAGYNATAKEKESAIDAERLLAADGKPPYGLFDVTAPDGQVYREVIREDGTFSSTSADGSAVEGVWEQREAGIFCSRPVQAPSYRCKYEEVNADGIWTSTELEGGEVSIVRRLEP